MHTSLGLEGGSWNGKGEGRRGKGKVEGDVLITHLNLLVVNISNCVIVSSKIRFIISNPNRKALGVPLN